MPRPGPFQAGGHVGAASARNTWAVSLAIHLLVLIGAFIVSRVLLQRLGTENFVVALVGTFVAAVYTLVSFRYLSFPFLVWILSIGGFRFIWSIQTPLLPDLSVDRIAMAWLTVVFMLKFFYQGRSLRRPFTLDVAVLLHGAYILVKIIFNEMEQFHDWTMSYLIPYSALILAKNIFVDLRLVRRLLLALLLLLIYYEITAIAEKFDIGWLLYPQSMLTEHPEFRGRSCGPFRQAPLFGTIIGMMLPIHLYFIEKSRSRFVTALLFLSLGAGFAAVYFSYTRGSWLAAGAALIATAVLNPRRYLLRLAPLAIVSVLAAVFVLGATQDKFLKERVENRDTIGSRIGTAVTAMRMFRDHPVLGVGFYEYRVNRYEYLEPVNVPGYGTVRYQQFRDNPIHDIYLGPLAEDGLVGAFLQAFIYLLILKAFLAKFAYRSRGDEFAALVMPVLAGICAGYLVGGMVIDYRYFSFVGTLFYVAAGIIDGYRPQDEAATPAAIGPEPTRAG